MCEAARAMAAGAVPVAARVPSSARARERRRPMARQKQRLKASKSLSSPAVPLRYTYEFIIHMNLRAFFGAGRKVEEGEVREGEVHC